MDPSSLWKRGSRLVLLFSCTLFFASVTGCASRESAHVQSPAGYPAQSGYAQPPPPAADSVATADASKTVVAEAPPRPAPPQREESSSIFDVLTRGKSKSEIAAKGAAGPMQAGGGQPTAQPQAVPPAPAPKADPTQQAARERELIIYTARVTMAVYQVDQGVLAVEKIAQDSGGYLATKQDRAITIRVPRARFQDTLAKVDKIGDVLHRDVQAQDVTDEHLDLEIRIKNARAMRARLQDLLAKANVKEALEIEKELHRVTEELERLEGKLKLLADKIAYSTITVAFEPRGSQIRAASVRLPFPWLGQVGLPGLLQLNEEK
jgi:hypothetical protein